MIRKIAAGALVAGAVLVPTAAHAGTVACATNVFNVAPRDTVNCVMDTAGYCVTYYDPIEYFPDSLTAETIWFVNCVV